MLLRWQPFWAQLACQLHLFDSMGKETEYKKADR
jgi:hypothetical protein